MKGKSALYWLIVFVTMTTSIFSHVKDKNDMFTARGKDMIFSQKKNLVFNQYDIIKDGILRAADKLEALKNISAPSNTKELLSLLRLITHLNRFSGKVAELTAPLRELTKKNVLLRWEQHQQAALNRIKEGLCSAPIFSYLDPDPVTTTILQCDAGQKGFGAWMR